MNELDELLKSLRAEKPQPAEIARWKSAVMQVRQRPSWRWFELVVAMLVGVVIGSTVVHKSSDEENVVQHATVERVITKIE
jgi:hypothetical protein